MKQPTHLTGSHHRPDGIAWRLAAEWDWLCRRSDAIERARAWAVTDEPFDDLDQLIRLAGFGPGRPTPAMDDVLHRLFLLAADDDLAARIVLQRIMPLLLGIVRNRARGGDDAMLEELVGAAWITIREYQRDRRPVCVVAALADGAFDRAYRRPSRRCIPPTRSVDPQVVAEVPLAEHCTPCEELADLLAEARRTGRADEDDIVLVRQLLAIGSPSQMAADLGVTPRTIRNRRDRVTYRLRQVALAA